jgi:MFS family permease
MNTLGNIGGLIGPLVVGVAVDRWHSWTFPFYITALVYAGGALAWLAIDPTRPVVGSRRPGSEHLQHSAPPGGRA